MSFLLENMHGARAAGTRQLPDVHSRPRQGDPAHARLCQAWVAPSLNALSSVPPQEAQGRDKRGLFPSGVPLRTPLELTPVSWAAQEGLAAPCPPTLPPSGERTSRVCRHMEVEVVDRRQWPRPEYRGPGAHHTSSSPSRPGHTDLCHHPGADAHSTQCPAGTPSPHHVTTSISDSQGQAEWDRRANRQRGHLSSPE
ncbi:hypothetical protein H1C71_021397 [Ictidomys tridecemlineatus]|nr:hypothetical protein H1C71_021397 [Ictidomys tridecemlineatus]